MLARPDCQNDLPWARSRAWYAVEEAFWIIATFLSLNKSTPSRCSIFPSVAATCGSLVIGYTTCSRQDFANFYFSDFCFGNVLACQSQDIEHWSSAFIHQFTNAQDDRLSCKRWNIAAWHKMSVKVFLPSVLQPFHSRVWRMVHTKTWRICEYTHRTLWTDQSWGNIPLELCKSGR